jgi:2-(1,2-epoxy-1,2-dihydrophenyl)acetyl-CoA isomerase
MAGTIHHEIAGAVARITIERGAPRDGLGPVDWRALRAAIERVSGADAVRVLVIAGLGADAATRGDPGLAHGHPVLRDLRELPVPVVAPIDGHVTGSALALALACDLRVASSRARFRAALHADSSPDELGAALLLKEAIGGAAALDLLLLSDEIDAAQALRIGLVHRVYPAEDFTARAEELVARVAALPTAAVAMTKRGVHRAARTDLASAIEDEAAAQALIGTTDDAAEGLRAFREKRAPRFRGG